MGMRAVTILLLILSLNASAFMLAESGMNDVIGVSPDTGLTNQTQDFDRTDDGFESVGSGIGDYLGFTVAAVGYFVDAFVLLGATESAFLIVGFPRWLVWPMMNLVIRPIWTLAGIQVIRGVVLE
jgi:hypothetical protein